MSQPDFSKLRVALAHHWFLSIRGGEKVAAAFLELFPQADVYTLFYDPASCGELLKGHQVYSSCLDKSWLRPRYQKIFPFYPLGVNSLKLKKEYDLLISIESGPIKGLPNPYSVPHICYINTPMRYCWGFGKDYLAVLPFYLKGLAKMGFDYLRHYDLTTVDAPDTYLANSANVAQRVSRYYRRNSAVLHAPISDELFLTPPPERSLEERKKSPYLYFGALTPYKRVELLVDTFATLDRELIIAGSGTELKKLKEKATPNIRFTGRIEWDEALRLFENSRALLFPAEEDFGLVPLEAMSRGLPAIAFGRGGALETVVENRAQPEQSSGIFFNEQSVASLKQAIRDFESMEHRFHPATLQDLARPFSKTIFLEKFRKVVGETLVYHCLQKVKRKTMIHHPRQ